MRGLCWIVAAVLLPVMGCDDEAGHLCVPGETRRCECGDGRTGAQWCNADGDAWACCHCDGSGDDDDDDDDVTDDDDDEQWPGLPSTMQIEVQFWAAPVEGLEDHCVAIPLWVWGFG